LRFWSSPANFVEHYRASYRFGFPAVAVDFSTLSAKKSLSAPLKIQNLSAFARYVFNLENIDRAVFYAHLPLVRPFAADPVFSSTAARF
jgi:hypothetical protein